jgi:hypothetical protein
MDRQVFLCPDVGRYLLKLLKIRHMENQTFYLYLPTTSVMETFPATIVNRRLKPKT